MEDKQLEELYQQMGAGLANVVAQTSFMLYQKEDFRKMVTFDKISQTEQDRIFNELQVSFLGLLVLYLENLDFEIKDAKVSISPKLLRDSLVEGFLNIFKEIGIEEKFIKLWDQLIEMRLKEYHEDYQLLTKETKGMEQFKKEGEGIHKKWLRVETITLDCLSHIRRGKLKPKDPLRKCLLEWFGSTEALFSNTIKQAIFDPKAES